MTLDRIDYEEPYGSFTMSFGKDDTTATRIFKIDWGDLADFLIELKGGYRNAPTWPWTPPSRLPNFEFMYCTEADVVGLGKAHKESGPEGDYTAYEYAKVTGRYESQKVVDDEIDDPTAILEETLRLSAEFLVLPERAYLWESDDILVQEEVTVGKLMPTFEYNITRPSVENSGANTLLDLVGMVNDATWRGITAGQALFLGSDADRTTTTDGAENWRITYSFLLRAIPHNYFFRPTAGWELIIEDNGGPDTYVYNDGDFSALNLDQGTLL